MVNLKSFFILDGPIGRKQFIINIGYMFLYCFIYCLVLVILHSSFEVNKYNIAFFAIMWLILLVSYIYVAWVNYAKRFWDVIGDKGNAIFYSIAIWIASNVTPFIPVVKYVAIVFVAIVFLVLLFKKGKLVLAEVSENNDSV